MNPDEDDDKPDHALAARVYEGFHWGNPPRRRRSVAVSPMPRELVELGKADAIIYSTRKGDKRGTWQHEFGEEGGAKPVLAVDPRSSRLHLVGGDYRVEDRGIVD